MAGDTVIKVENLGKMYRIGSNPDNYKKKNIVTRTLLSPISYLLDTLREPSEEEIFWALKDINFEVKQGEVLGIVGRNGAGKSTLLKILSRITEPTIGSAKINGRIGSLLEVGTGFHPDLTGRENVFLNGSLLGMKKQEIKKNFDEIVAFSGVEKFIDTPVKKYSSGMHVRLGFAVAAHLQPEILIIDEVLAVGDVEFQKKCLGKMQNISDKGRTVLFVSHNMNAVQNICTNGIYLKDGKIVYTGKIESVINEYLKVPGVKVNGYTDLTQLEGRNENNIIKNICLKNQKNEISNIIYTGDDLTIEIEFDTKGKKLDYATIGINTNTGQRVTTIGTHLDNNWSKEIYNRGKLKSFLPKISLAPGYYQMQVAFGQRNPFHNIDTIDNAIEFTVYDNNYFGTNLSLLPGQGNFVQKNNWELI